MERAGRQGSCHARAGAEVPQGVRPLPLQASTAEEYRRSVELFIDPRIGKHRVPDIQRSDIAALHHDMRETPY